MAEPDSRIDFGTRQDTSNGWRCEARIVSETTPGGGRVTVMPVMISSGGTTPSVVIRIGFFSKMACDTVRTGVCPRLQNPAKPVAALSDEWFADAAGNRIGVCRMTGRARLTLSGAGGVVQQLLPREISATLYKVLIYMFTHIPPPVA